MSINVYTASGNLTADPRKGGNAETPILNFDIAISCVSKAGGETKETPLYVPCTIYGNRAKSLFPILAKGMNVTVTGRLVPEVWEGKDGVKHASFKMVVNDITLPRKNDAVDGSGW